MPQLQRSKSFSALKPPRVKPPPMRIPEFKGKSTTQKAVTPPHIPPLIRNDTSNKIAQPSQPAANNTQPMRNNSMRSLPIQVTQPEVSIQPPHNAYATDKPRKSSSCSCCGSNKKTSRIKVRPHNAGGIEETGNTMYPGTPINDNNSDPAAVTIHKGDMPPAGSSNVIEQTSSDGKTIYNVTFHHHGI